MEIKDLESMSLEEKVESLFGKDSKESDFLEVINLLANKCTKRSSSFIDISTVSYKKSIDPKRTTKAKTNHKKDCDTALNEHAKLYDLCYNLKDILHKHKYF